MFVKEEKNKGRKMKAEGGRKKIHTITRCYKVPSNEIGFVSAIIDSYEGMATIRTLDQEKGYIEIWISPDFEKEINNIIEDLKKEIEFISNI